MIIEKFLEHSSKYKIIPKVFGSSIVIEWIDKENTKKKLVGHIRLINLNKDKDNVLNIVGYIKDDKSVNGYQFIKMSIDYLLNLGYTIISDGNRSEDAARVWNKLEKEYNIKDEFKSNSDNPRYIPERHNKKILLSKK